MLLVVNHGKRKPEDPSGWELQVALMRLVSVRNAVQDLIGK